MSSTNRPHADITVVVPVRNRAATISSALESIGHQSVAPAAVIVVDDGSRDATRQEVGKHDVTLLCHRTSLGAGEARNTGIKNSATRWIAFLDSDDYWLPDHLETMLESIDGYVFASSVLVDTHGRARGNTSGLTRMIQHHDLFFPESVVCTSTVVAERSALIAAGLFRTRDRAEDLDLWVRLLEVGSGCAVSKATGVYGIESRYPTLDLQGRNRAGTRGVLDDFASESWATSSLRRKVRAQGYWDDFRLRAHHKQYPAAAASLANVLVRPWTLPAIFSTIRHRKLGRSGRWADALGTP